jgi:hypothetical protein
MRQKTAPNALGTMLVQFYEEKIAFRTITLAGKTGEEVRKAKASKPERFSPTFFLTSPPGLLFLAAT